MNGPFRVTCQIREEEWADLHKIVLHNPRGSSYDEKRTPLRGHSIGSLTGSVNFGVGSTPLFSIEARSFEQSTFALASMILRIVDRLNESTESVGEIGMLGSDWKVTVARHGNTVQITSNWQSNAVLTCQFHDFVAGANAFVDQFSAEVFVREPLALKWTSLEYIRAHVDKLMLQPLHIDCASCFDWSIDEAVWQDVVNTRRVEPPGSEYDKWMEAASNLFGASVTFIFQDNYVSLTPRLTRWSAWQPVNRLRRGKGKAVGMHPFLFDQEPWPLLDLAIQLAGYLDPSLFSFADEHDDEENTATTGHSRSVSFPNVPYYNFILHHSVILDLEVTIGKSNLAIAARQLLNSFVRAIYSHGGGAVDWDCLLVLRAFAIAPSLKVLGAKTFE